MEPATKADLDALRADTKADLHSLRADTKADLDALRADTKADLDALRNELTEQMRGIETTLLREFRKWAVPMNTRTRIFEVTSQSLTERLSLVEERLDALETR